MGNTNKAYTVTEGETILKRMRKPFKNVEPEQIKREVAEVIEEVRRKQPDKR